MPPKANAKLETKFRWTTAGRGKYFGRVIAGQYLGWIIACETVADTPRYHLDAGVPIRNILIAAMTVPNDS
jgi:hypothetical protein